MYQVRQSTGAPPEYRLYRADIVSTKGNRFCTGEESARTNEKCWSRKVLSVNPHGTKIWGKIRAGFLRARTSLVMGSFGHRQALGGLDRLLDRLVGCGCGFWVELGCRFVASLICRRRTMAGRLNTVICRSFRIVRHSCCLQARNSIPYRSRALQASR